MKEKLIRSHYCGRINEELINSTATVMGWVQSTRDMGGVIFMDLRDKTGILQVVFNAMDIEEDLFNEVEKVRSEFVVAVKGEIKERDEETYNPKIPTGTIELKAKDFEILSRAKALPFPIELNSQVREDLRLKYRYLDLRRPNMYKNFVLRDKVVKSIRKYLENKEFMEVETPILTKSTPEGARDYLVPSRVHPAKFYALPQSPQIFKQLLMTSGFDRYYQIARCFRDEDLRADRQPEFTQVDMELSFINQEDILKHLEDLFKSVFLDVMDLEFKEPFPRLTWREAMDLYGSDKPDLRFGLQIVDLTDIASECNFKVFRSAVDNGGLVRAINVKGGNSFTRTEIEELTEKAISYGSGGMAWIGIDDNGELRSVLTKFFTDEEMKSILERMKAEKGDLIIFSADKESIVCKTLGNLRLDIGDKLGLRSKDDFKFLIVTDFPLLEWSEEDNRYVAMHHPFTMPVVEDLDLFDKDPGSIRAQSYDIVLNGIELGSGSIRIHRSDIQQKMFELLGFNEEDIEARFGFLIEAFSYGTPPHGGFAFGLDRLVMMMAGADSIRDVIAFPKTRDAYCPLTDAPNIVDKEQLDILDLAIIGEENVITSSNKSSEKQAININIEELANLSKIDMNPKDKKDFEEHIQKMLDFTSNLKDVDVSKYEPITNIHPQNNVLRDDIVKQEYNRDELLSDAIVEDGYIVVPQLIDEI